MYKIRKPKSHESSPKSQTRRTHVYQKQYCLCGGSFRIKIFVIFDFENDIHGITVIIVGNRLGDTSSNPE